MFSKFDMFYSDELNDILQFLDSNQGKAMPIAGGTDVVPRLQNRKLLTDYLVNLSGINELKGIKREGNEIRIGALTTIAEIRKLYLGNGCDIFNVVGEKFGSPPIRNLATLGGNLGVALSASDFLLVFTALGAKIRATSIEGDREIPVDKLVLGKRQTTLRGNEIISEIIFPDLDDFSYCNFEKFGRRNALEISLVSCCVYLKMNEEKNIVKELRATFNRLQSKTPECCIKVEDFWKDRPYTKKSLNESLDILDKELLLSSDYRASKEYRSEIAKVLFKRAFLNSVMNIQKLQRGGGSS
jgi:CO/xanthine dehydrogenase FAD-binding subunit